jgi:hypothetical protein
MTNFVKKSFLKFEMKIFIFEIWKTFGHTTIGKWIFFEKNHFEIRTEIVFFWNLKTIWPYRCGSETKLKYFVYPTKKKLKWKNSFWILKWKFSFEIWKKLPYYQREMKKRNEEIIYFVYATEKKLPTIPSYHHTTYVYHPIPLVLAVVAYN